MASNTARARIGNTGDSAERDDHSIRRNQSRHIRRRQNAVPRNAGNPHGVKKNRQTTARNQRGSRSNHQIAIEDNPIDRALPFGGAFSIPLPMS